MTTTAKRIRGDVATDIMRTDVLAVALVDNGDTLVWLGGGQPLTIRQNELPSGAPFTELIGWE